MTYTEDMVSPIVWAALRDADRWGPEQHGDELAPFAEMVYALRPKNVLEIGVRRGGTVAVWHGISTGYVIGMDLPGDEFNEKRNVELEVEYLRYWGMLFNSHKPEALAEVKRRLLGEPLDLLFVDGDHSPEGIADDWATYSPLVRKGGIVGLHDIAPNVASMGVHAFWQGLKLTHEATEFTIGAEWGGLGAIRVSA